MKKNKVRYFIISFLMFTVLSGDIFLSQKIETHTQNLREYVKSVTETQRKERYDGYREVNEIKADYTGYRVWKFTTALFVVFCLLVCERRQKDEYAK